MVDAQSFEADFEPARAFERAWALGVPKRALALLECDFEARHRTELFRELQPYLVAPPSPTDVLRVSRALGMTDASLRVTLFRMRRRLADLLRGEVANALADREDRDALDQELRALVQALSGGAEVSA